MTLFRKAALASVLAATALASATPAMARDHWGPRHRGGGGNDAAIAIGAGVVGLAIGALIASASNDKKRDRYDDRQYDGRRHDGGAYDDRYDEGRYDDRRYDDRRYDDRQGRGYDPRHESQGEWSDERYNEEWRRRGR
ncbi:MAG: hypothetical protein M0R03_10350 [Novosphingobium sp.]|nr:hypothetical protein [Novosphingobium sp.]